MLAVSAVGFLDATYLTVQHYLKGIPPCTINGCEVVLTSGYATVYGIPIALAGSAYYLTLLLGGIYFLDSRSVRVFRWFALCTVMGLAVSFVLVGLQLFVIKALCLYCMISAVTSTTLFILGMAVLNSSRYGARPLPKVPPADLR